MAWKNVSFQKKKNLSVNIESQQKLEFFILY